MPKPIDLKDGILVLKVALKKSWAKKASYWVEVWQVPMKLNQQKTLMQWVAVRSWKFTKKDFNTGKFEEVRGQVQSSEAKSSFHLAFERAINAVDFQMEKDYSVDTVQDDVNKVIHDARELLEVQMSIKNAVEQWSKRLKKSIPVVYPDGSVSAVGNWPADLLHGIEEVLLDLDHRTPFKVVQAKRLKKARW